MSIDDFKGHRVIEFPSEWWMEGPAGSFTIPRDGRWQFNGDYVRPTFTPSVNETCGKPGQSMEDFKADPNPWRSHLFVRDGKVEYLGDCTHEYAGQTHELKEVSPARAYSARCR